MIRKAAPDSLLIVLTRRVGFRKAMKVLAFIGAWGIATEDLGHAPETVEEYAYWWRMSAAKAFREQRVFREAFPDEATPERIWSALRTQIPVKDRSEPEAAAAMLGSLALPT